MLDAIRRGLPYKQASALAGISYMTFTRWRKAGKQEGAPTEFRDFCDRLEQAEAEASDSLLRTIQIAGKKKDWRAAAWVLERRFPEEWGKRETASEKASPRSVPTEIPLPPNEMDQQAMLASLVGILRRKGTLQKFGYSKTVDSRASKI